MSKHDGKLKELHSEAKPGIMLYGIYNAGKSTLLNAIIGKSIAEVGDVPTTYETRSYPWSTYELFDTPGIGAPIEHEKVSNAKLDDCHVIVFVVSAKGSFEEKQIYEQMKYIIDKKKKLLIALNDKDGLASHFEEIKIKILTNLGAFGGFKAVEDKYKVILVNAKDALIARLEGEERLERSSNIGELEADIEKEIKRVNGFAIFRNALKNLLDDLDTEARNLFSAAKEAKEGELNEEIRQINEEYWNFVKEAREIVKQQCAGLANAMFGAFPKEPSQNVDEEALQNKLAQAQERYQKMAVNVVQGDLERIRDDFAARIGKNLEKIEELTIKEGAPTDISLPDLRAELDAEFSGDRKSSSSGSGSALDALDDVATILTPLPFPPLPVPIPTGTLIKLVTTILKAIFGGSNNDDAIEDKAAAMREAEERRERERVRWRQEIRDFCVTQSEQFVMNLQLALQKQIETVLKPSVEDVRKVIGNQQEDRRLLQTTIVDYHSIKGEIERTLEDLSAQA